MSLEIDGAVEMKVCGRGTKHVIKNVVGSRLCLKCFRIHLILILIGKQQ